jgi:3-oxoacyl-[acyl-carrier protein] reductase
MRLEGRRALVTGSSRGIGRAIALALAAEGADVAINYRSREPEAAEVVAAIRELGRDAVAIRGDVADYAQAEALVAASIAGLGGLEILVNNAGIAKDGLIFNLQPDDWVDVMRVNFGGVFHCTKAVLEHFMGQREGAIVNVSSVMGERGWIGDSNYAASKAAVNAFTRSSAMELVRFGIRVNAVLAGFVPTELVGRLLDDGAEGIRKQIPMRSFATAEDVAGMVAFLCGPDARYMTGALIPVDGGSTAMLGVGAPLK